MKVLPLKVIFHHGDHCVLNVLLFSGQALVHILLERLGQALDDDVRVADLGTVQFDKGQEAAFGAELGVVSDILEKRKEKYIYVFCRGALNFGEKHGN